jgi:hypothetical protein
VDVEVAARDGRGKRTELNRSGSNRVDSHHPDRFLRVDRWLVSRPRRDVRPRGHVDWERPDPHGAIWRLGFAHLSWYVALRAFSSYELTHGRVPAIISYLASFVLVRYSKISVPISEEASIASPAHNSQHGREATTTTFGGTVKTSRMDPPIGLQSLRQRPITSTSEPMITIERVYLWKFLRTKPTTPLHASSSGAEGISTPELQDAYSMLLRCNSVCVVMTFIGLLLAILGIMAYVWTTFALAPGIFVSVCFILSLIAACYALR